MKTGTITFKLTVTLVAITTLLIGFSSLMIWNAWQDHQRANLLDLRNELTKHFNQLASNMALERGIGNTILGGDRALLSQFAALSAQVDTEVGELLQHLHSYRQTGHPSPDFESHLTQWNARHEAVRHARLKVIAGNITPHIWFETITESIAAGFALGNQVFAPIDAPEAAIYYNAILRPHIAILAEFAGRERGVIGHHLAKGIPISPETLNTLQHYRDRVEQAIEQIRPLKEVASSPPELKQAIKQFEQSFLGDFQKRRQEIYQRNEATNHAIQTARSSLSRSTQEIQARLAGLENDLQGLVDNAQLRETASRLQAGEKTDPTPIRNLFANLANVEKQFLQISYLDASGRERVRLDHHNAQTRIVPESELVDA
ncbi:MAG: hypothetical protein HQM02_14115, partial [Magnetococcales bacterium]|nr:hypothetical protein [Magnetococcales bacterium]